MTPRLSHIISAIAGASVLGIAVYAASAFGLISLFTHKSEPVNASAPAVPAGEVKREPKVTVPVKAVQAYRDQREVKVKLDLPAPVIAAPQEQVISTAKVPDSNRPHTVTTTLNTDTGESTSYVRADPYPWFKPESQGEASLSVGYKYSSRYLVGSVQPVARLQLRQDFLQVKAIHFGVVASVDSDRDAYIGVGIRIPW